MTLSDPSQTRRVVIVTGPSGAGRSTAINALEDIGFEAIDNLPLSLIDPLLNAATRPVALGIDARNREFSAQALIEVVDRLEARSDIRLELVYLNCSDSVLIRRFSETRRRHPLAPAEDVMTGIRREADLLGPVLARADILIETSDLSPHDLKAELHRYIALEGRGHLAVSLHSFSYKRGLPRGMDMVFDARFLRNPYWDKTLRDGDGRDAVVQNYVGADPRFDKFLAQVRDMSLFLLPAYKEEGKAHLSIAFGCSGGRHRSVTLVERLAKELAQDGWPVSKRHRELERMQGTAS